MIERVEVSAIVHATEDPEKVLEALSKLLGIEGGEVEVAEARGHHGNPILYLKMELKGKEARRAVERLLKLMDDFEYELLKRELGARSEGSKLYLRFDKQKAFGGEARLSSGSDVVRIVIVFKGKVDERKLDELRST
ncbi:MAG: hypothetical protein GXO07_00990 [Crenarchaeota archaeon]|nr:hypothetical protein [Thermoproteota archaeon]